MLSYLLILISIVFRTTHKAINQIGNLSVKTRFHFDQFAITLIQFLYSSHRT